MKLLPASWAFAAGVVLLGGAIGVAAAHPTNLVIANGGSAISGGGRALNGTIGQSVVGSSLGAVRALAHGYWAIGAVPRSDVGQDPVHDATTALSFGLPHPNPANSTRGAVRFAVRLPRASLVGLAVYDVAGRLVAVVRERRLESGNQSLDWNPGTGRGGVYFVRLLVNGRAESARRVVLVE